MKLNVQTRENKKSEVNKLRREGNIPAIIYVQQKAAESIVLKTDEFAAAMRKVIPGRLSTTVFTLVDSKGKERRFIIKEIQYHPTTYNVMHMDFEELHKDVKIKVKIPIECIGLAECSGIKLGGALRQVIRYLPVSCYPKDMPEALELDISDLGPRGSHRLKDLKIPENVRPLADLEEVVAVIVKR